MHDHARILKAASVRELGSRVAFNYDDLRKQCDDYLAQTQLKVSKMIDNAALEAELELRKLREAAAEQGRREGLQAAQQLIEKQSSEQANRAIAQRFQTLMPALQKAAGDVQQARQAWMARWESLSVELSMAVAEKLVHTQLSRQPERAVEMLRAALQLVSGTEGLTLRLHPDDHAQLGEYAEDVVRSLAGCGEVTLTPDPKLARGDCLVETRHGQVDARIETMLQRIAEELTIG